MDAKGIGRGELAAAIGISYQGVRKVFDSDGAFGSENNLKAADYFGVRPKWLATGEGEKLVTIAAPPIPYVGPTNLGRELALVFDMIPESDTLKRSEAYRIATAAIAAVLQDERVTLVKESGK
jgi:hypothetical protein